MRYPKSMNILGQKVDVELVDNPLLQFYTCPKCGPAFKFPLPFGKGGTCPACGHETPQPIDNTYAIGQYNIRTNKICTWASRDESVNQMCETSFVHETIEAINSICDLQLKHTQITTLAASIYQAFSTGGVDFSYAEVA